MVTFTQARLAMAILMVAFSSLSLAQVRPSVSTDPLNGSTFSTPVYQAPTTYTITTTFPSAGVTTPVVISGTAGPSPATGPYTFSYNAPTASLTGVQPSSLYSSLAANGEPTQYTSAFQPDLNGLQVADSAMSFIADIPFKSIASMAIAGTLAAIWIL